MEKNYSSTDRSAVIDRALSLPHFDEEATLLSARPVVPLNEVKTQPGSKPRRMIFALTIIVAILVGAVSATLLLQNGWNTQNAADTDVSQPTVLSAGAAGGSTSAPAEARVAETPAQDEEPLMTEVPGDRDSSTKKRATSVIARGDTSPTISRRSAKPAKAASPDSEIDEDFENDARELIRAERRDARRDARRQGRQRREQRGGDDLMRIQEIFEGSPRP